MQTDALILKHLPPSNAVMRVLDLGAGLSSTLREQRQDLDIHSVDGTVAPGQLAPSFFDAVIAIDPELDAALMSAALHTLRPGGRLIVLLAQGQAEAAQVSILEEAGYTRILVEAQSGDTLLLRGEKPHVEQRTVDRIRQVAGQDSGVRKPFVYLLIQQTPNKPVWALRDDEQIEWQALALSQGNALQLLAFSSLPKAVAFMQPAVLQGRILDVNKVGKFKRETALAWPLPMILDPGADLLTRQTLGLWSVDPKTAEQPDE
jgi:hypothetical protein